MARLAAVLDANILFRRYLRDTLLHAADAELFRPLWTDRILDEACKHLIAKGHMTTQQTIALRDFLWDYFEGAWVEVSEDSLARAKTNDPDDDHVLAVALEEGADMIVTENVSDFPPPLLAPFGVTALSADAFLLKLYAAHPEELVVAIQLQRQRYTKSAMSFNDLLEKLAKVIPKTVKEVEQHLKTQAEAR